MQTYNITTQESARLAEEMQELIKRVIDTNGHILRFHTCKEVARLEEISNILRNCENIDNPPQA